MKPAPVVIWSKNEPPAGDRPGTAILDITFARNRAEPVRVVAHMRSDHSGGRGARVQSGPGVVWDGSLVWAAFRWTEGDGPSDLLLSWFAAPPDLRLSWRAAASTDDATAPPPFDPLNYAEVSDVALLARDPTAQWAVRAFLDELPKVGPPAGTGLSMDEVVAAVIALRRGDRPWPTQEAVAEGLGIDPRTIRRVGAWQTILAQAKRIVSG